MIHINLCDWYRMCDAFLSESEVLWDSDLFSCLLPLTCFFFALGLVFGAVFIDIFSAAQPGCDAPWDSFNRPGAINKNAVVAWSLMSQVIDDKCRSGRSAPGEIVKHEQRYGTYARNAKKYIKKNRTQDET